MTSYNDGPVLAPNDTLTFKTSRTNMLVRAVGCVTVAVMAFCAIASDSLTALTRLTGH